MSSVDKLHVDKEKLKKSFDLSHFDPNAVIRGAQLTLVGGKMLSIDKYYCGYRRPLVLTSSAPPSATCLAESWHLHYRSLPTSCDSSSCRNCHQAHYIDPCKLIGSFLKASQLMLNFVQIIGIKVLIWFISLVYPLNSVTWDDTLVGGLDFVAEYVLQVPFFLMALMRYVVPTLDNL